MCQGRGPETLGRGMMMIMTVMRVFVQRHA